MACSGLNCNNTHIQNKKYNLCGDCVFKKSHGGKSKQEVYQERAKERFNIKVTKIDKENKLIHIRFKPDKPTKHIKVNIGFNKDESRYVQDEISKQNEINQNLAELEARRDAKARGEEFDLEEFERERSIVIVDKSKKKKKQKPIKRVSGEQSLFNQQLSKIKIEIEQDALSNDSYFCTGCGKSYPGLDKSHILSLKNRKDLGLEKANITLHCRTCHLKWESGDIAIMHELLDFDKNLKYIQSVDLSYYRLLIGKIRERFRGVIYKIINLINDKIYIGSTCDFVARKRKHLNSLRIQNHHSVLLQRSFDKYGEDAFKFQILEEVEDVELLLEREQYYLDLLKPSLNMTLDIKSNFKSEETILNFLLSVQRAVYQINIETLKIIKEWDSARCAMRGLGFKHSSAIAEVCSGVKLTYKGYFWRYVDQFDMESLKIHRQILLDKNLQKKINQFSSEGVFIKTWNSIQEASIKLVIDKSDIWKASNGRLKTAGGYIWKRIYND